MNVIKTTYLVTLITLLPVALSTAATEVYEKTWRWRKKHVEN